MTSRTITTDATGRREATPDLATVEALAIGEGGSAGDARAIVKDRAATIRESVTAVPTDQIKTVDVQVQDTGEMFDPATEAPFQATERLRIECLPENAESVVVDVTAADGTVRTVDFHLHGDVRQQLQNEALVTAMERAREKAAHIATAEDLVVGEVQEVTTREVSSGMESIVDEALEGTPDTGLHPATVTVTEEVEVVYGLAGE